MKNRIYVFLVLSFILASVNLFAQSLERYVISSAGLSVPNDDIKLSFTVGETVVFNTIADEIQLTQGFQQANIEDIPTGIDMPSFLNDIVAYPNPVGTVLHLDINSEEEFEFSLIINDLTGRQLALATHFSGGIGYSKYQIDLRDLVSGIYMLVIKTKDGATVRVFKIRKI